MKQKSKWHRSGDWIKCLCVFVPPDIPMDQWDAKSVEEKEKEALWTAYRFRITEIQEYTRSPYPNASWISFRNGSYKNIDIPLETLDTLIE